MDVSAYRVISNEVENGICKQNVIFRRMYV